MLDGDLAHHELRKSSEGDSGPGRVVGVDPHVDFLWQLDPPAEPHRRASPQWEYAACSELRAGQQAMSADGRGRRRGEPVGHLALVESILRRDGFKASRRRRSGSKSRSGSLLEGEIAEAGLEDDGEEGKASTDKGSELDEHAHGGSDGRAEIASADLEGERQGAPGIVGAVRQADDRADTEVGAEIEAEVLGVTGSEGGEEGDAEGIEGEFCPQKGTPIVPELQGCFHGDAEESANVEFYRE